MKTQKTKTPKYVEAIVILFTMLLVLVGGIAIGSIYTRHQIEAELRVQEVTYISNETTTLAAPERKEARLKLMNGETSELYLPLEPLPIIYVPPVQTLSATDDPEPQLPEEEKVVVVEEEVEPQLPIEDIPPSPQEVALESLGNDTIETDLGTLTRYELPSYYYPKLNFWKFQAWMPYTVITNKSSAAYKVVHSDLAYVDEYGMLRSKTSEDQFTIDGKDDFVIALGTYYKPKGTCGDRWLIVTSTGSYTAITGDEKADIHTDKHNMVTYDGDMCTGVIEFLIDYKKLNKDMKLHGTVTMGPIEELQGEILYMYRIS